MIRSLFVQITIFALIFSALTSFRQSGMLSNGANINQLDRIEKAIIKEKGTEKTGFSLPSIQGELVNISTNNQKTILYFFAPWCSICHMSIENLQDVHSSHPEYNIIAIALDYDSSQDVVNFSEQHRLSFPVVLGTNKIKNAYKISAYPSYYVLNQQGKILSKSMGYSTEYGMLFRTAFDF